MRRGKEISGRRAERAWCMFIVGKGLLPTWLIAFRKPSMVLTEVSSRIFSNTLDWEWGRVYREHFGHPIMCPTLQKGLYMRKS